MPDWRDAAAYAPLLVADRSLLAWEWLRRNPQYRASAGRAVEAGDQRMASGIGPAEWGLHTFVPPEIATPDARPIWRSEVNPLVLRVEAGPAGGGDDFDLELLAASSTVVTSADGRERVLISDGLRAIRIDVLRGSVASGPVELRYGPTGLASLECQILTLRRLVALWKTGRFSRPLHPVEARAKRWVLMLRTTDALVAGADQREIAAVLLSAEARGSRWRTQSPSLRSRVQRLVRSARAMEAGEFRNLLSSPGGSIDARNAR